MHHSVILELNGPSIRAEEAGLPTTTTGPTTTTSDNYDSGEAVDGDGPMDGVDGMPAHPDHRPLDSPSA